MFEGSSVLHARRWGVFSQVSSAQIRRSAPVLTIRVVHSEGKTIAFQILRVFDTYVQLRGSCYCELNRMEISSYEYGPCVGVTRLERWERAQMLGLNPPFEVTPLPREHTSSLPCVVEIGQGHSDDQTGHGRRYIQAKCILWRGRLRACFISPIICSSRSLFQTFTVPCTLFRHVFKLLLSTDDTCAICNDYQDS